MEFFLLIGGQKAGPFTIYEVAEQLRSGAATPETMAWTKGMDGWQPLRELGPMRELPELRIADAGGDEIAVSDAERAAIISAALVRPRPWTRFWARIIDMGIFTTLVLFLANVTGLYDTTTLADPSQGNLAIQLAIPAAWIFVEATLLFYFGTTPGKWLLAIRLGREDKAPLGLGQAYRRSLSVWWRGYGIGLPPLSVLAFALSYMTLTTQDKTIWDAREDLRVEHGQVSTPATLIGTAIVIGTSLAIYHLIGMPEELAKYLKER